MVDKTSDAAQMQCADKLFVNYCSEFKDAIEKENARACLKLFCFQNEN